MKHTSQMNTSLLQKVLQTHVCTQNAEIYICIYNPIWLLINTDFYDNKTKDL